MRCGDVKELSFSVSPVPSTEGSNPRKKERILKDGRAFIQRTVFIELSFDSHRADFIDCIISGVVVPHFSIEDDDEEDERPSQGRYDSCLLLEWGAFNIV